MTGQTASAISAMRVWFFYTAACFLTSIGPAQALCPVECVCGPDDLGRRTIRCTDGDMVTIPVNQMNHKAQIVTIAAPNDEHPNFLTIGPIFIQPKPFSKLEELHIVNSNIPFIGQHSFWGLQNLRILNLTRNNISTIVDHNFRGLLNLTNLYLDDNRIEQMPSETFRYLSELRILSLANNRIATLVPRLFRMLAKLHQLDLSDNALYELNPEVFKDIQDVRILKCRRCKLKRMNPQIYHLLRDLQVLDLGENNFKYLTADEFVGLKNLEVLYVDGNQFPVIIDNSFSTQEKLHTLSIARNRLAMLTPGAFNKLVSLKRLDISYNKLDRFNLLTFAPLVYSLRYIDFSGNNLPLSEISSVLQMLPEINGVGIGNLSIKTLPDNFLQSNPNIISLSLAWNHFTAFPVELLAHVKFLQYLDFSKNKLQGLNEQALLRLESIAEVNISANPWNCEQCDINNMLSYMLTTVLNETIRNLKCSTPKKLKGVLIADLIDMDLNWCSSDSMNHVGGSGVIADEGRLSIIAGLLLIFFIVISAIAAGICYSKRRTAEYYTNEEKRRSNNERMFDNQLVYFCENDEGNKYPRVELPEKSTRGESDSVATIHAPYQMVPKGS